MPASTRYATLFTRGERSERIPLFSDAVFAIAMTLLVIELHAPEVPADALPEALINMVGPYLTFALSFVVIALIWLSHFRKFRVIVRFDPILLRLNLLMLFFVASLPLPTAILGEYGDTVAAVVVYAATICAVGFSLSALWLYAWHAQLIDERVTIGDFRFVLVQSFPVPGIFALSIPIAFWFGATAAELTWILALPASWLLAIVYRHTTLASNGAPE